MPIRRLKDKRITMQKNKTNQEIKILAKPCKIAVIIANFYHEITDQLYQGAREIADAHGISHDVFFVDGALEIPPSISILHKNHDYDGYLALGCIIRGETYHFEIVANESARGIMDLGVLFQAPIGNCILTVENLAQAQARADINQMNKGGDAMRALIALLKIVQHGQ